MVKIFIINLNKSTDRRENFIKNNSKYLSLSKNMNDDYTFFEAIDGNSININLLPDSILQKKSVNYTKGSIGCALSHLALWEKCIELNEPILIMEDDVILHSKFMSHLNNVYNNMLPIGWDIVQLSYNCDSIISYHNTVYEKCVCSFSQKKTTQQDIDLFILSKINPTVRKLIHSFGTSSYLLSPSGAKKFKEKCFPLNNQKINIPLLGNISCFTIDCMMNAIYKDTNSYICIIPFVMSMHLHENYKSTI